MDILLSILALVLSLLGVIGAVVPVLPGVVLSYAGLVCAYFCGYSNITPTQLLVWAVVSVVVTVADFVLPPLFTKKLGGSRAGVIGSTVGLVAGLVFFPPLGIILGPIFGAVLGELLHDKSDTQKAFKMGMASLVSFIFGTGLKLIASLWMLGIFLSELIDYVSSQF